MTPEQRDQLKRRAQSLGAAFGGEAVYRNQDIIDLIAWGEELQRKVEAERHD